MEPAVLSTKVSGFKAEKQGWEGSWGKEEQSQEPPDRDCRERGQSRARGVKTPTLTPPSDFLFSRLLAAVKTKRKIKPLALSPLPNLKSGSRIRKSAGSVKGARRLLKPLEKALPGSLKARRASQAVSDPQGGTQDLSCHGRGLSGNRDTLHVGGETTFSTGAAWDTGNSAFNSFHPGLEAECQGER